MEMEILQSVLIVILFVLTHLHDKQMASLLCLLTDMVDKIKSLEDRIAQLENPIVTVNDADVFYAGPDGDVMVGPELKNPAK